MKIGDILPQGVVSELAVSRELKIADVIRIRCNFIDPVKHKYMVICCCEPLLVLIINSEINEYIQRRPHLLQCQVDISKDDHRFFDHDSVISCIDAHDAIELEFTKQELEKDYFDILKGSVQPYCMREVYLAVKISKVMIAEHKRLILDALYEFSD